MVHPLDVVLLSEMWLSTTIRSTISKNTPVHLANNIDSSLTGSRELPFVSTIHAFAEGRHRFIGGSSLSLCVCNLLSFAFTALHAIKISFGLDGMM